MAKSKKAPDHADPIIAQKIRDALNAMVEEREKVELPPTKPPEELQRWALKPLPKRGKGERW